MIIIENGDCSPPVKSVERLSGLERLLAEEDLSSAFDRAADEVDRHLSMVSDEEVMAIAANEKIPGLFHLCLPQIQRAVDKTAGLGVERPELILDGFESATKSLVDWCQKNSSGKLSESQRTLRGFVLRAVTQDLVGSVVSHYGLAHKHFWAIELYFQAQSEFKRDFGRFAQTADQSLLAEIFLELKGKSLFLQKQELRCRPKGRESQRDQWGNRLFDRIHALAVPAVATKAVDGQLLEGAAEGQLTETVKSLLDGLVADGHWSVRKAKIITRRFGLDSGISLSLEEVAREFGVTRERIRQQEGAALRDLRNAKGLAVGDYRRLRAWWREGYLPSSDNS